jgi:hypothetical protein
VRGLESAGGERDQFCKRGDIGPAD